MYKKVSEWIDSLPLQNIPEDVAAFCFNLYDEGDNTNWSMELIGASEFDPDDGDWACDEVTDFESRDGLLKWEKKSEWDTVLNEMTEILKKYMENGKFASQLKSRDGVGVGFVDGDIEILFTK